jgi:AcrR family transcriptional regulator
MTQKRLDKTIIVRAAADLLNRGLPLTLGQLAKVVHIKPPSLYNHIDGLPGLYADLALLSTRELGEKLTPSVIGKSGQEALIAMAQAYRTYIKENPGLYPISVKSSANQPNSSPEMEQAQGKVVKIVAAIIASFGIEGDQAIHVIRAFRSLVHGFATLEINGGFGLPQDCNRSFDYLLSMYIRTISNEKGTSVL